MADRAPSLVAQARKVDDLARRMCAGSQRLQTFQATPEPSRHGLMAATRARLRTLDLRELRETYGETLAAIRAAKGPEELAVLQLARTLIRQEIRHRGASPHELLFLSSPETGADGIREERGGFL
ncbi:hypothetical protein [Azospirillum sp. SYSU D00513]|uniref:hypothetical protein n=1 Tax=Azospirillum sp. SYSU D00513 TaxID=2812561 RepID=UPI001A977BAE|nr:hypothetical protein [Azospirillum sp. SYSU D00513]